LRGEGGGGGPASIYVCAKFEAIIMQIEPIGGAAEEEYSEVATPAELHTDDDVNIGSQELTEDQIEDFIRCEQQAASEGNNADTDSKYTPQIGMEFRDRNDAHNFFSFYGFLARFGVVTTHTVRTTHKKKEW